MTDLQTDLTHNDILQLMADILRELKSLVLNRTNSDFWTSVLRTLGPKTMQTRILYKSPLLEP